MLALVRGESVLRHLCIVVHLQHSDKGMPAPDVVIYLDMAPEAAARRGQYGEEKYENIAMQTLVHPRRF